ncbi:hypothetical protein MSG28_008352 [Choristoneura fumiferana]|uniref:Uncharacterized protein n=1 Tax=Choristoneura fumiferana TaxID=7141 RepID=A0ACC0JBG8_CHOFU|nr:hypothetical protein MSG28_008352 [Choristoneura fumiferana]
MYKTVPIRAPLMALEHCIAPFLERCDDDDDHRITLAEWGKCLELAITAIVLLLAAVVPVAITFTKLIL